MQIGNDNFFWMFLHSAWGELVLGIGVFGVVARAFWNVDGGLSEALKEDLSLRLLCLEAPDSESTWANNFIALFDLIFRSNCRSGKAWQQFVNWRSFFVSSFVSCCVVVVLTLILLGKELFFGQELFAEHPAMLYVATTLVILIFAMVFNVLPDYVSVLETRYLLRFMRGRKILPIVLTLLIDVVLTTAIFAIFLVLIGAASGNFGARETDLSWWEFLAGFVKLALNGSLIGTETDSEMYVSLIVICFYSTFTTSIWIWLFGISHAIIRFFSRFSSIIRAAQYALPIETRPVRSIGIVTAFLAMIGYWTVRLAF